MRKWRQDDIDVLAYAWARQRKIIFGITPGKRLEPRDRLGKLRCTLGQLQDEAVSAGERSTRTGENGHPLQNWPEVYVGMALELHRARQRMTGVQQLVMDLHYVWCRVPIVRKCREHKLTNAEYWTAVRGLKDAIRKYLGVPTENEERQNCQRSVRRRAMQNKAVYERCGVR